MYPILLLSTSYRMSNLDFVNCVVLNTHTRGSQLGVCVSCVCVVCVLCAVCVCECCVCEFCECECCMYVWCVVCVVCVVCDNHLLQPPIN